MLPIDPDWRCCRSGDCCLLPPTITVSEGEAALLRQHAPAGTRLEFRPLSPDRLLLTAGPCPLYDRVGGRCTVYSVRPYRCRTYVCLRPDVTVERLDIYAWQARGRQDSGQRAIIDRHAAASADWAQAQGWTHAVPS